ncbi:hypothetical protein [Arhodomonas sp. AD133]|uniref:DUF7931 domain-containing protein n=1 Tax=Arhodomonas sp. AD133 TaxID=3415009 RepID=UPI003EC0AB02
MQDAEPTAALSQIADFETLATYTDRFASSARTRVDVVTPNLEPQLYDRPAFVAAVERFALDRRDARVRILVADAQAAVRYSRRLIPLTRRLPSVFELRQLRPKHADSPRALLIIDGRHVIDRPQGGRPDGVASEDSPGRAKPYAETFEALYAESDPHTEFRGLQL